MASRSDGKKLTRWSNYLDHAFASPTKLARHARKHLADVDFDTMVGTGLSGALVIPALARSLRKYYMIVRKHDDSMHADYKVEGVLGQRWIFVDDFISSGETFARVNDVIADTLARQFGEPITSTHVGSYLYASAGAWRPFSTDQRYPRYGYRHLKVA